jgi:two-component system OmpR family sensor kinase
VTVRGYAELYRMGAISGDEQTAQSMERIEKEAIRMGGLVEDLLALARLDERRDIVVARGPAPDRPRRGARCARDLAGTDRLVHRRRPTPGGAASGIRAADGQRPDVGPDRGDRCTAATPAARRRRDGHGTFPAPAMPLPSEREPIVLGDENRIRQVVANLLGNARRYTPAGSPIELAVGVDEPGGMGWISVIDHGEGIARSREKIFQRFWRADTSRTRETGGSGLGLSIVASVVDALHGSIVVSETPGGATFRVAFPLAQRRDAAEHLFIETQPLPRLHIDS